LGSTAKIIINEKEKQRRTRLGCILGLILLGVLSYLIFIFLIIPFFESGGGNIDTREVPGDPSRFDPIGSFADIKAYAGDGAELTSIDAYYVRVDGTMELTAENYNPRVSYEFVREVPAPADAPPLGAGGGANSRWYEAITIDADRPGKWWHVTSGSSEYSYMNKGMERDTSSPTNSNPTIIPDPACTFTQLWETALEHDAPREAVAIIRYDQNGYDFSISDAGISLQFDSNCRLTDD
jgi:hypothetical protein